MTPPSEKADIARREATSTLAGSSCMGVKQYRRSISVRGTSYMRVKRAAAEMGISISEFTERLLEERCNLLAVPVVDQSEVRAYRVRAKPDYSEHIRAHFTF